ncbi:MAG: glycosyltransferase family 2 protein [Nitrosopumilaceae archaeon]
MSLKVVQKHQDIQCNQKISSNGRIVIKKRGWILRLTTLTGLIFIIAYNIEQGLLLGSSLIVYSTLMPLHTFLVLLVGWFFYKNPANGGQTKNDLVSVIIPIFNQESMITFVIDAIYNSTHKNIEVLAVNDGSTDHTRNVLDQLTKKYPNLKVIHKKNEGKRLAVAAGFYKSKGRFVVLIDSDSVVDKNAIREFMKTFSTDPKIGAVVGYAKVWNSKKNLLTKCQDCWYDYAFNIHKTTESTLNTVMCCSGCLAGYRRNAIEPFIPYWIKAKIQNSDDRDLTTYVYAPSWGKTHLAPLSEKLMESVAKYDDAEDRMLTAASLVEWKSVYVASAIVYTEVPEKIRSYIRQQTRWKKGYIRSNFFASTFFWKKNPIIAIIFYIEFMSTFSAPVIISVIFVYVPIVYSHFWIPLVFTLGSFFSGLAQGIDYKLRDPKSKTWKFKPLMNLFASFGLSWLVIPAILTLRKNQWLTR